MTLSDPKERVKLLKAGIPGKCIEMRYLEEEIIRTIGWNQYQPPRSVIDLFRREDD